jgi:hypothetical protein
MVRHSLLVIALLTSTAVAQPGDTGPSEPPPNTTDAMPPPTGVDALDLDALVARAEAVAPSLETVARGAFRRARRSISIGPTAGLWSAAIMQPGELDAALTFGFGIEAFKVPVLPDMATLKALIQERLEAQLKDRVKAALARRPVESVDLDQILAQVYADVRDEILGMKDIRGKTMERPRYSVGFEANRVFGAERWLARTRVGIGVWKLTLGLSVAAGRVCRGAPGCDDIRLYSGPEIVAHFLMSKKPRASVVDVFARFDLQTTGRATDTTYDQLVLGARYLLDVF